jgi:hypothetical protein
MIVLRAWLAPRSTHVWCQHDAREPADDHHDPAYPQRGRGYWGTISRSENGAADPAKAWEIASRRIAEATEAAPEGVRDFLDSRLGRHFADEVANGLSNRAALEPAIEAAITCWMGWRIDRRTEREDGIPRELPYLTGWVTHFHLLDEMQA